MTASRRDEMSRDHLNLKPSERNDYGITVTIKNTETEDMITFTEDGPVRAATRRACDYIDGLGPEWKVLSISTPATIFGDIQGKRDTEYAPTVEMDMLSHIGRSDLAIKPPTNKTRRNHKYRKTPTLPV